MIKDRKFVYILGEQEAQFEFADISETNVNCRVSVLISVTVRVPTGMGNDGNPLTFWGYDLASLKTEDGFMTLTRDFAALDYETALRIAYNTTVNGLRHLRKQCTAAFEYELEKVYEIHRKTYGEVNL